jgi:hypothetical protein
MSEAIHPKTLRHAPDYLHRQQYRSENLKSLKFIQLQDISLGFLVDKATVGQDFLGAFQFPL